MLNNFTDKKWMQTPSTFTFRTFYNTIIFAKKLIFGEFKIENKFLSHAKILTNLHAECECGRSTQIRLSVICMFVDKCKYNNLIAKYGDTNVISHTYNEFMHSALIIKPQNVQFILINYYVISCVNSFFFDFIIEMILLNPL